MKKAIVGLHPMIIALVGLLGVVLILLSIFWYIKEPEPELEVKPNHSLLCNPDGGSYWIELEGRADKKAILCSDGKRIWMK